MPKPVAVTPTYASGDLAAILEIEYRQLVDTVMDLSEEQMIWRPNLKAKSALDILWHLAYAIHAERPANKTEALENLRRSYEGTRRMIAEPGKLDEPVTWWTGERIPFRGVVWGQIRHYAYHLGELVYLRQVMGIDEPKYYHEE